MCLEFLKILFYFINVYILTNVTWIYVINTLIEIFKLNHGDEFILKGRWRLGKIILVNSERA